MSQEPFYYEPFFDELELKDALEVRLSNNSPHYYDRLLTQREEEIVTLYFGLDSKYGKLTLEEIAKKQNLTRERVRQIKEKGIDRIKNKEKYKPLLKYFI